MLVSSDVFTVWKRWSSSLPEPWLSQDLMTASHQRGRVEAGTPFTPKQCGSCSWAMSSWHTRDPLMAGVSSCRCVSLPQRVGAPPSWEVAMVGWSCSPSPIPYIRVLSTSCHWHCYSFKTGLGLISGAACSAPAPAVAALGGSYELLTWQVSGTFIPC